MAAESGSSRRTRDVPVPAVEEDPGLVPAAPARGPPAAPLRAAAATAPILATDPTIDPTSPTPDPDLVPLNGRMVLVQGPVPALANPHGPSGIFDNKIFTQLLNGFKL